MIPCLFQMVLLNYLVILLIRFCNALIGYDCDTPYDNGTTVSLFEPDECNSHEEALVFRDVYVELLQHPRFIDVNVLSCRVEIDNVINDLNHKGINSKNTIKNKRYYLPLNMPSCILLHAYGKLQLGNFSFHDLTANDVNSRLIMPNKTSNAAISSSDTLKPKQNVNTYIHVVFKQYTVKLGTLINKISLPIGTTCIYTNLECTDEEGYQNFWSPVFHKGCEKLPQSVKYRGIAKKLQSPGHPTAYSFSHSNTRILLFIRSQHDACNVTVFQTEHPRLVVREISDDYLKNRKSINNLRLLSYYTNSYINLVNNINQNIKDVYVSISMDKCIKKEIELRTSITIADKDPSLFAYALMGTPGYTARIRGEAAQLLRCTPVPARLRTTGDCFMELPVTVDDKPMYLQPKTRIITTKGTEISCDPLSTAIYKIKSQWYILTPEAKKLSSTPEVIRPGLLPWGRKSAAQHPRYSTDELEDNAQNEQSINKNTSPYISVSKVIISIMCLILIFIVIAVAQKFKNHSPMQLQSRDATTTKMQSGYCYAPDDVDLPQGSRHEHHNSRLEPLHRIHNIQEEHLNVPREIYNLKAAYRNLEMRINNCTSPMQAGLDELAVASFQRCSKLNEGGVTYGAST